MCISGFKLNREESGKDVVLGFWAEVFWAEIIGMCDLID